MSQTAAGRFPAGTVTFLFTDIEGSTACLQALGEAGYAAALGEHRREMRAAFQAFGGVEVDTQGDAFLAAFAAAGDAVAAAVRAQQAHRQGPLRARMGIHTGHPILTDEGYVGIDLHRGARVAAAGHGGQVLLSQAAVDALPQALPAPMSLRELGRFRLKDLTEPQALYQVEAEGLPSAFPRLRTLEVQAHNLPVQLTPLVGRRGEIATVIDLLRRHRLVTLTAAGGTGKTRLSLQVAAELLDEHADGVWFVDLAAVSDSDGVAFAVAAALRVADVRQAPILQAIGDAMRRRQALVILDNCEQVVGACAEVAQALLAAAPATRILATSRELLGVPGEALYRLPSLALAGEALDGDPLASEAVQLFVERARAARHDLALTRSQLAVVARICRRVDGIPLAIELAAARVRSLSFDEIDRRLDDRFRLLTGGARTALPRQQTLRSLIDWSHDLLDAQERTLFARLSVFAGGWDAELAAAVCADDALAEPDVLDVLLRLVDKSMVVVRVAETDGEPTRYRMLDTLRAYGAMRLAESGEGETGRWRRRHLDRFVQSALAAEQEYRTSLRIRRREVRAGFDDMRAAFGTALEIEPAKALPLAATLGLLWAQNRGRVSEASSFLATALAAAPDAPAAWRGFALRAAAHVATIGTRYDVAIAMADESLALMRALDDRPGTALALRARAVARTERGDIDAAEEDLLAALEIQRALGMEEAEGHSLISLGFIASMRGQRDRAFALFEQAGAIFRRVDSHDGLSIALNNIAAEADAGGDLERARVAALESIEISRRLNDRQAVGYTLLTLAHIDWKRGDIDAMRSRAREGLTTMRDLESRRGIAYAIEYAAVIALHDGEPAAALVLLGAASALRRSAHAALDPDEQREIDELTASARRASGKAADAAWASGESLSQEEAVATALGRLAGPSTA